MRDLDQIFKEAVFDEFDQETAQGIYKLHKHLRKESFILGLAIGWTVSAACALLVLLF